MEQWTRWQPIVKITEKFYVESLNFCQDSLIVKLFNKPNTTEITLTFHGNISAFRCTEEAFCMETLWFLNTNYTSTFYANWSFFKIAHSKYVKSLFQKTSDLQNQMHFCLFGGDHIIDIITSHEPTVEILTERII